MGQAEETLHRRDAVAERPGMGSPRVDAGCRGASRDASYSVPNDSSHIVPCDVSYSAPAV